MCSVCVTNSKSDKIKRLTNLVVLPDSSRSICVTFYDLFNYIPPPALLFRFSAQLTNAIQSTQEDNYFQTET